MGLLGFGVALLGCWFWDRGVADGVSPPRRASPAVRWWRFGLPRPLGFAKGAGGSQTRPYRLPSTLGFPLSRE